MSKVTNNVAVPVAVCTGLGLFVLVKLTYGALSSALGLSGNLSHILFKLSLAAVALACASWVGERASFIALNRPAARWWPYIPAGLALGAIAAFTILITESTGVPGVRALSFPQLVFSIWLISSITEEIFVRGFLQPWIDNKTDRAHTHPAVLASSVIFGAMHLSLPFAGADAVTTLTIVTGTTLLGYCCAVVRRTTGSLIPAIVVHVMFNVGSIFGGIAFFIVAGGPPKM